MKLRIILEQMYEITENLHAYTNSWGPFKDGYLVYGKFYQNIEDIEFEEKSSLMSIRETKKYIGPKAPDNAGRNCPMCKRVYYWLC